MNHDFDDSDLLAADTNVPTGDDFEDDTYNEPDDHAFESIGGLYDEHVEREVRHILARVFGM